MPTLPHNALNNRSRKDGRRCTAPFVQKTGCQSSTHIQFAAQPPRTFHAILAARVKIWFKPKRSALLFVELLRELVIGLFFGSPNMLLHKINLAEVGKKLKNFFGMSKRKKPRPGPAPKAQVRGVTRAWF
jgi:hypothetical protein